MKLSKADILNSAIPAKEDVISGVYFLIRSVKYVHELQNLIFSIEVKELEIKAPQPEHPQ